MKPQISFYRQMWSNQDENFNSSFQRSNHQISYSIHTEEVLWFLVYYISNAIQNQYAYQKTNYFCIHLTANCHFNSLEFSSSINLLLAILIYIFARNMAWLKKSEQNALMTASNPNGYMSVYNLMHELGRNGTFFSHSPHLKVYCTLYYAV